MIFNMIILYIFAIYKLKIHTHITMSHPYAPGFARGGTFFISTTLILDWRNTRAAEAPEFLIVKA